MYDSIKIQETISNLKKMQQAGISLAEATKSLHLDEHVPFDDIWPAIMKLHHLSEKEAMQLTKEWCVYSKNGK